MERHKRYQYRTDHNTPDLELSDGEKAALRALRVLEAYAESRVILRRLGGAR